MPCPVCGYANPAGAAKCAACGTQLIAEPTPAPRMGDARCATHPEQPALQPCARCGTFYCSACLEKASDGQLYCVQCRSRRGLAWDQREEHGVLRAWFLTSKDLMLEPTQTLEKAPRDGSIGSSLLFALLSSLAGWVPTLAMYLLLFGGMLIATLSKSKEEMGGGELGVGAVASIAIFIVYALMAVGGQVVSLFVLAGIEHVVLSIAGEKELGPYTVTVRAHALGLAPFILGLVPVCGLMVMSLWSLVLRCITLMHLQKVTAGKAAAAVLAPVLAICGCFGIGYFFIIAAVLSSAGLSR